MAVIFIGLLFNENSHNQQTNKKKLCPLGKYTFSFLFMMFIWITQDFQLVKKGDKEPL